MRVRVLSVIAGSSLVFFLVMTLAGARQDLHTAEAVTTTTTIRWGPYTVPAASGGVPGQTHNGVDGNVEKPCTDCYVTSVVPNLIDVDGSTINFTTGGMLHHMVLFDTNGTDVTCGSSGVGAIGERILASGNERAFLGLPDGYGYYIGPGSTENWLVLHDIMNMTTSQRDVYLEFEFTYRPGTEDVKAVTPAWLDQDNCADSEFSVPAGYSDSHWDWTAPTEGDVVSIGGHVHDYGISIAAEDVTQGEFFCEAIGGYPETPNRAPVGPGAGTVGHPASHNIMTSDPIGIETYRMNGVGRISDVSGCQPMFRVQAGDTIRLHTQYNSPAADNSVMGIMVAYVHPTTGPTATPVTPTPTPTPLVDTDGDGCPDTAEQQTAPGSEMTGGLRDYANPWDYYDVTTAGGVPGQDQIIDLPNDILGVILHFSPTGAPPYDANFDRGPWGPGGSWVNTQSPDGVIDLPNDILGVILQFFHDCR